MRAHLFNLRLRLWRAGIGTLDGKTWDEYLMAAATQDRQAAYNAGFHDGVQLAVTMGPVHEPADA